MLLSHRLPLFVLAVAILLFTQACSTASAETTDPTGPALEQVNAELKALQVRFKAVSDELKLLREQNEKRKSEHAELAKVVAHEKRVGRGAYSGFKELRPKVAGMMAKMGWLQKELLTRQGDIKKLAAEIEELRELLPVKSSDKVGDDPDDKKSPKQE